MTGAGSPESDALDRFALGRPGSAELKKNRPAEPDANTPALGGVGAEFRAEIERTRRAVRPSLPTRRAAHRLPLALRPNRRLARRRSV
jgi:hypothetical protein